jgi:crotonobetainyl-CoA:carnitine CoA-transferase CaiB-like acyl-CoA transferase
MPADGSNAGAAPDEPPLAGIRVLDLGQYIAGPGAAMALRELGADVVKVEPIGGDAARHIGRYGQSIVRGYNRGKRTVALDLRDPRGVKIVARLAAASDVVIQNLRPGAVERLGLGPARLRALHPRLVYLSVSGFGTRGPSRDRPGLDIAAQAESGMMSITGEPDRLPQKVGAPIIDAATAHVGAQAVLAALFRRERRGVGETIELSLLDVAMHLQQPTWVEHLASGRDPVRTGDGQPNNAPAADLVPTADGHIVLSAYDEAHWARFCRLFGRESLVDDERFSSNARRVANRPALKAVLGECLSGMTSEEAITLLAANQIVAGAVRTFGQAARSVDVAANGLIRETLAAEDAGADAPYRALGRPYRMAGVARDALPPARGIGADSVAVLSELGYDGSTIDALVAAGVVGAGR